MYTGTPCIESTLPSLSDHMGQLHISQGSYLAGNAAYQLPYGTQAAASTGSFLQHLPIDVSALKEHGLTEDALQQHYQVFTSTPSAFTS